jgi:hypothetical protein
MEIRNLNEDVKFLHSTTKLLRESTEQLLSRLDTKLDNNEKLMMDTNYKISKSDDGGALGFAVKLFAGLAGVSMIVLVYACFIPARTTGKKFV